MKELFRVAYELDRRNLPFALVTVIGTDGIIPRQNGRMQRNLRKIHQFCHMKREWRLNRSGTPM